MYSFYNTYVNESTNSRNSESKKIASAILASALRAPITQILQNAGKSLEEVYKKSNNLAYTRGYDVVSGAYGDMFKMGIIDPMKVTKTALQNAVSVAITILSTNAIVTMARSYEHK